MISLKKYLDGDGEVGVMAEPVRDDRMLPAVLEAYRAAMLAMGNCTLDACPSVGDELKQRLGALNLLLSLDMSEELIGQIDVALQEQLRKWSQRTALHLRDKASEVKDLLLVIARTAESLSARDERCTNQMSMVRARLEKIATLDDVTQIRSSVEEGAEDLKNTLARMTAEGNAALEDLRKEVKACQARLVEAEELASRDALTRVRNRMYIENLIETKIAVGAEFCVAMIDVDGFKIVNDTYGHLVGDEMLKSFAGELRSACRSTDVIGRWGGDEFILLMDGDLIENTKRIDRLARWVCGDYSLRGRDRGVLKLSVKASFGVAGHRGHEPLMGLIARADAAMYANKAAARANTALRPTLRT
jgi:diguanylate cyclase (GGDEF)-like protein